PGEVQPLQRLAGDHRLHLRMRQGLRGVDRDDPGVRVRAAQHRAVQHPGQHHVVDVGALAAYEPGVLLAQRAAEAYGGPLLRDGHVVTSVPAGCSAAQRTARTMFSYPVQRHSCPEMASRISPSDGSGLVSSSARAVISIPGVQNPHCRPWHSMNPCCTGSSWPLRARPSTVRISWPWAITASMVQDFSGLPSNHTTQVPQLEVSHPQWVPVRPRCWRRKCTSSSRGSTSRVYSVPLTVTVISMALSLSSRPGRRAP